MFTINVIPDAHTRLRFQSSRTLADGSHCGSDFIFASVLCKIIDVMTPFSEVE